MYLLRSILYLHLNYLRLSLKEVTEVFPRMILKGWIYLYYYTRIAVAFSR